MFGCFERVAAAAIGVAVVLQLFGASETATGPDHDKVVVCYVSTWAVYRPNRGSFSIDDLNPALCTHIVYAFAGLNVTDYTIRSLDPWQDLKDNYGKGGYEKMTALRSTNPHLKVTLAIGGWNEGSGNYSAMVGNHSSRGRFIASVVDFVRKYKFDGLDLDWEFPGKRGGKPEDKKNFVLLVKELRSAFDKFNLLLTAAFGAGKDTIDVAYDVPALEKYLDYIHTMCYDYHGAWDLKTGANAPLRSSDVLNVDFTIHYLIKLGASPRKLVVGLPLYGRTFLLTQTLAKSQPLLGDEAKNEGFQGPFTKEKGFMGYNEICLELNNASSGWIQHWDDESKTPFAINGDRVITYDNERSLHEKVRFAMQKGLAGVMVWSIDTDDFHGDCASDRTTLSGKFNNFPLMRSVNEAIVDALEEIRKNQDKENEIPHGQEEERKGDDASLASLSLVMLCASFVMQLVVRKYV